MIILLLIDLNICNNLHLIIFFLTFFLSTMFYVFNYWFLILCSLLVHVTCCTGVLDVLGVLGIFGVLSLFGVLGLLSTPKCTWST